MASTKIEWTNLSWNPVTGCTKVSPGCKNCYAEKLSKRLKAMGVKKYENDFMISLHPEVLTLPLSWKKQKRIFVNSMSDLFHENIPLYFVEEVFKTMRLANWHNFQVLTKRSDILLAHNKTIDWPSNVWMGVSVESQEYLYRINDLRRTKAKIKFLSLEPLLGSLNNMNLEGIDWVIVGGESGVSAREMREEWVLEVRDKCIQSNVPFFFKQWGGVHRQKNGRELQGRTWDCFPKLGFE